MPQSLAVNLIHLVYGTKERVACLSDRIQPELFAYKAGILKQWESPALIIGGTADHVHILFSLSRNHALKTVVEHVKKGSTKWLKEKEPSLHGFLWQAGYGAFSVSSSNADQVTRYIENQHEHHRNRSYTEEFRELLRRHGIEFDERYVWD